MSSREITFPLVPRHRLLGLAFGAIRGARRGIGTDVAGSRPYRPGDDRDAIDWRASARLSSARDTDEFIVRERYADDAPRVVIVVDRRPEMALSSPDVPWLRKHEALSIAAGVIADSVAEARGLVGYLDFAEGTDVPFWRPPSSSNEARSIHERHAQHPTFAAPDDNLTVALEFLEGHRRSIPSGTFLFVLSDFLFAPAQESWERVVDHRWDVVPVVVQDPVWEQSFPPVDGIVVPLAGADGRVRLVRLREGESEERRREHERRRNDLLAGFIQLGVEPVLLSASDRDHVLGAFLEWAAFREFEQKWGWR
jgi:uncharacterized protein (DUF58 family)